MTILMTGVQRLNEQGGLCGSRSEPVSNDPAQLLKLFLSAASMLMGALGKASEPARGGNWLMTS